jgi:hypothetical protein
MSALPFATGFATSTAAAAAYHAWKRHRNAMPHSPSGLPLGVGAPAVHGVDFSHDPSAVASTMGFEWMSYLLGLGTLPGVNVVRNTLHQYTSGPSRLHGEDEESSMGFEWMSYLLGLGTLPGVNVVRNALHQYTGAPASRMYGEPSSELLPLPPWEIDSTSTDDILYGDTERSMPEENLGRMRF